MRIRAGWHCWQFEYRRSFRHRNNLTACRYRQWLVDNGAKTRKGQPPNLRSSLLISITGGLAASEDREAVDTPWKAFKERFWLPALHKNS